jgi:hypothetical protein
MMFQHVSRSRIAVGMIILVGLIGGLWFWESKQPEPTKAKIALMSSIPLQWGEVSMDEIAKGEDQPAFFYQHLSAIGEVTMIDTVKSGIKSKAELLILVQPRLLNPQELVDLDRWVRRGGRALIFADPALQWPSRYPLGDGRRPLFTSFLSPLFAHWGVELVLPVTNDEEQVATVELVDATLQVISHGNWIEKGTQDSSAKCQIDASAVIATCTIEKGRAILIADADLLQDALLGDGVLLSRQLRWINTLIQKQVAS